MKKTVCLNMIVKNESPVISRCLESVKALIDYWVIVDTGSIDGTQKKIKEVLKSIPGELHERPWVDFAHNRNEALHYALGKTEYLLFMDADDYLTIEIDFKNIKLTDDIYIIEQKEKNEINYYSQYFILMIRNTMEYKWEGVLHEALVWEEPKTKIFLQGIINEYTNEGSRSLDPQKTKRDIQILEQSLIQDPHNSRYVFYLAFEYMKQKSYKEAISYFQKRTTMRSPKEWVDDIEIQHSLLQIALAQKELNYPEEIFVKSLCTAYLLRPTQAKALYELSRYYIETNQFLLGYLTSSLALSITRPTDSRLTEPWIYEWGVPLQFFICCSKLGKRDELLNILSKLLLNKNLPESVERQIIKHMPDFE